MNPPTHEFRAFQGDSSVCVICGKSTDKHSIESTCEVCGKSEPTLKYQPARSASPILYCKDCLELEHKAEAQARYNEMTAEQRVEYSNNDWKARIRKELEAKLEHGIQIRTDVFNAKIPSILELRATVDADESIPSEKKNEAYAELINAELTKLREVIFPELNQVREQLGNHQKSLHQYLNEFVKNLTLEERAKIKLVDINYQPKVAKVASPKKVSVKAPKFDREAIAAVIKEFPSFGLSASAIQSRCVSRNMTPQDIAAEIRKNLPAINEVVRQFPFLTPSSVWSTCASMNKTPAELAKFFEEQSA